MAANIDEAIAEVAIDVTVKIGTLVADMNLWLVIFGDGLPAPGAAFDQSRPGNRLVRNWQAPTRQVLGDLTPDAGTQTANDSQAVIEVVFRCLHAVKFAAIDGLITANQQTSIVNQYNTAWA